VPPAWQRCAATPASRGGQDAEPPARGNTVQPRRPRRRIHSRRRPVETSMRSSGAWQHFGQPPSKETGTRSLPRAATLCSSSRRPRRRIHSRPPSGGNKHAEAPARGNTLDQRLRKETGTRSLPRAATLCSSRPPRADEYTHAAVGGKKACGSSGAWQHFGSAAFERNRNAEASRTRNTVQQPRPRRRTTSARPESSRRRARQRMKRTTPASARYQAHSPPRQEERRVEPPAKQEAHPQPPPKQESRPAPPRRKKEKEKGKDKESQPPRGWR